MTATLESTAYPICDAVALQSEINKWVERVEHLHDMEVRGYDAIYIECVVHINSSCAEQGVVTEEEFMNFSVFLDHLNEMKVAIELTMQENGLNKGSTLCLALNCLPSQ